jgi:hypothetical protein
MSIRKEHALAVSRWPRTILGLWQGIYFPARPDATVEAPIVFVADGITAPEQNYDDYRGIDAKGKIVAFFYSAPNFESSPKGHYTAIEVKEAIAVAHGAVGFAEDSTSLAAITSHRMTSINSDFSSTRRLNLLGITSCLATTWRRTRSAPLGTKGIFSAICTTTSDLLVGS